MARFRPAAISRFHVEDGEIVTLIGANGAGKSTTLRAVAGALLPRAGRIRLPRPRHHPAAVARARVARHRRWCPKGGGCFPF